MVQAMNGDTVKEKLEDGAIFDSSENREPLSLTLADQSVISGCEMAVIGMNPGDSKIVGIPDEQAYGLYEEDRVVTIDRNEMPDNFHPVTGKQYQLRTDQDQIIDVLVVDVSESTITSDVNHPLAGKDLYFEIQLMEIV